MSSCPDCYAEKVRGHVCQVRKNPWLRQAIENAEWWEARAHRSINDCYRNLVRVGILKSGGRDLLQDIIRDHDSALEQLISSARSATELSEHLVAKGMPAVARIAVLQQSLTLGRMQVHEIGTSIHLLRG